MPLPELNLLFELDLLFQEFFASPHRPRYGVAVTDAEPDLAVVYVEIRFLANQSYCCAEPSCHLPTRLDRLICLATARSIHLPADVVVRWHCRVEEGAHLRHHGFKNTAESQAYEFDHVSGDPVASPAPKTETEKRPSDFTGLWTINRPDGTRIETEYLNGIPNGSYRYWDERGACLREGFKKDGLWDGKLTTRNTKGTVLDISEFQEGTGVYKIFNFNDQLTDEIPFTHGKPHGTAKRWSLGTLVEIRHYDNGTCVASNIQA